MPRIITLCNHEWYVLEEQGNKMLLLAKYIITRKAYHEIRELTSWGKCTLRKWLNGDFYKSLEECHVNILDTETDQGVTDKIFLLSVEEYRKYNPPTTGWWWWLRSP
ncbi:MAG: DUF6273 domain-containing protein, partial [Defluviitaleaceae bacterium]|nr:DUF6273 domain-containing protein [Defluviitaleaceae bacterium]